MNYIRALKSYKNFYAFTYTCSILAGPYKQEMKSEGVFLVKKWTFPQRRVHYVQYQYFFILHFTYLVGGACAPNAPPCRLACLVPIHADKKPRGSISLDFRENGDALFDDRLKYLSQLFSLEKLFHLL